MGEIMNAANELNPDMTQVSFDIAKGNGNTINLEFKNVRPGALYMALKACDLDFPYQYTGDYRSIDASRSLSFPDTLQNRAKLIKFTERLSRTNARINTQYLQDTAPKFNLGENVSINLTKAEDGKTLQISFQGDAVDETAVRKLLGELGIPNDNVVRSGAIGATSVDVLGISPSFENS